MSKIEKKSGGDPDPQPDQGPKAGKGFEGEHGYALLVGVGSYAYSPWSLPVMTRDVEALTKVLTDPQRCGYTNDRVRLLTNENATKDGILRALDNLASAVARDPDSTVVVYYSGHGCLREKELYFLLPHDADPNALTGTALPAQLFIQGLRQIQSQRLLVVLDTCHAAGMATAKDAILPKGFSIQAMPETLIQELSKGRGRAVFTSCRGEESSWIWPDQSLSLFTHHFIEALEGAGASNQPEELVVRVSTLMNYVARAVPESARKIGKTQTPFFNLEAEDFPVALIRGGQRLQVKKPRRQPRKRVGVQAASEGFSQSVHGDIGGNNIQLSGRGNIQVATGGSSTSTSTSSIVHKNKK